MLTETDHFSVRLNLTIKRKPRGEPSTRQKRNKLNYEDTFAKSATDEQRQKALDCIVDEMVMSDKDTEYEKLMEAVDKVLASLPNKKREPTGWCDINYKFLGAAVDERNKACREHASTKTQEAKDELTAKRRVLKKMKKRLKTCGCSTWSKKGTTRCYQEKEIGKRQKPCGKW